MAIRVSLILPCLLFALADGTVHAAELGDAQVSSHIGQQLVADVELTLIEDTGNPVRVRLAHPDVYRGASIAMPPVLSTLNMRVMRRDGRQFLHLTTLKPVESRHLHVYLELSDGSQQGVRLVTLWLTPDPNPQPVAAPVPASTPVSAPVVAAQPVAAAARPLAPPRKPAPATRPAAALHEGEEYVEAAAPARADPPRTTVPKVAAANKAVPPRPAPPPPQDAPAACAPQPAAAQVHACVALGEKNAALRHELGRLEEKMKVLQVAAGVAPAAANAPSTAPAVEAAPGTTTVAAPAAAPPAAPAPAAPKGAPRIQRKPKKETPPEPETPWLPIAGGVAGVLALAGLAVVLLRRRKPSDFGKIPKEHKPAKLPTAAQADAEAGTPQPGLMAAVKARLMPGSRRQPAPPVEPVVESAETQQQ